MTAGRGHLQRPASPFTLRKAGRPFPAAARAGGAGGAARASFRSGARAATSGARCGELHSHPSPCPLACDGGSEGRRRVARRPAGRAPPSPRCLPSLTRRALGALRASRLRAAGRQKDSPVLAAQRELLVFSGRSLTQALEFCGPECMSF